MRPAEKQMFLLTADRWSDFSFMPDVTYVSVQTKGSWSFSLLYIFILNTRLFIPLTHIILYMFFFLELRSQNSWHNLSWVISQNATNNMTSWKMKSTNLQTFYDNWYFWLCIFIAVRGYAWNGNCNAMHGKSATSDYIKTNTTLELALKHFTEV